MNFLLLTGLLGLLVLRLAGSPHSWEVLAHLPKSFSRPLGAQFNPIKTCTKVMKLKTYSLGAVGSSNPKDSTTAPATDIKSFPTKLFQLLLKSLDPLPCSPEMPGPKWDFSAHLQRNQ